MSQGSAQQSSLPQDLTDWLRRRDLGDPDRLAPLFSVLYRDLKRRAHVLLRNHGRRPAATIQTTGLVNEAYIRLRQGDAIEVESRAHFLALAARTMRWVLLDTARARKRLRRGRDVERVTFDEARFLGEEQADELIVLERALRELEETDPELAEVVELRFHAGLTVEETAAVLGSSPRTVKRRWQTARLFLAREMEPPSAGP